MDRVSKLQIIFLQQVLHMIPKKCERDMGYIIDASYL